MSSIPHEWKSLLEKCLAVDRGIKLCHNYLNEDHGGLFRRGNQVIAAFRPPLAESMAVVRGRGIVGGRKGELKMGEFEEKGDIDLNRVFTENARDLNQLFPDISLKKFLKEVEENKKEIKTFLKALEVEDEGGE